MRTPGDKNSAKTATLAVWVLLMTIKIEKVLIKLGISVIKCIDLISPWSMVIL
jgi:hypothetical protein